MATIKLKIRRDEDDIDEEEQQRLLALDDDNTDGQSSSSSPFFVLVMVFLIIPIVFPYYVLETALRDENLCHVGPVQQSSPSLSLFGGKGGFRTKFDEEDDVLSSLYGTYTSFDDASYYFVKTPYDIGPKVLPNYGYWSISTLSLTLLSPQLRRERQRDWKESRISSKNMKEDDRNKKKKKKRRKKGDIFFADTAPSIQWDQSHEIDIQEIQKLQQQTGKRTHYHHSSKSNRWCLVNRQDLRKYQKIEQEGLSPFTPFGGGDIEEDDEEDDNGENSTNKMKIMVTDQEEHSWTKGMSGQEVDLFKICGRPQTSIISDAEKEPFFIELPLHPPGRDTWRNLDRGVEGTDSSISTALPFEDDDSVSQQQQGGGGDSGNMLSKQYREKYASLNPYQVQVHCHVPSIELKHLANGFSRPIDDHDTQQKPLLGWEHAETISLPEKNPFLLPGTLIISMILFLVQLTRRGPPNRLRRPTNITLLGPTVGEDWNIVRAMQLLWFHASWLRVCTTVTWVYVIGSFLEPVVGTFPYIFIVIVFVQLIAMLGDDMTTNPFLLVCFGQAVVLSQLEPSLKIWAPWGASLEISVISFGDSRGALKVNVFCIVIALFVLFTSPPQQRRRQRLQKALWKNMVACLFVGWMLSKTTVLELLGAPQWTIPTSLLAHLWWNLAQLEPVDLKKIDTEETVSLCRQSSVSSVGSSSRTTGTNRDVTFRKNSIFSSCQPPAGGNTLVTTDSSPTTTPSPKSKYYCCCISPPLSCCRMCFLYLGFGGWMALTIGCVFTLDFTLVVGNFMTIWLYVGTNLFPRHPLWSLYHMVASTSLILLQTMTMTGWYLCHVAIATRIHSFPPPIWVYLSILLQTFIHTATLFHTVSTKNWRTSQQTPGCFFWTQIQIMSDKFCCFLCCCCCNNDNDNKYYN